MAMTKKRKREEHKQKHRPRVPFKVQSKNCHTRNPGTVDNNRTSEKNEDSFVLHLQNKWCFMQILGLNFTFPIIEHFRIDNNNDESLADNNENIDIVNAEPAVIEPKSLAKTRCVQCNRCDTTFRSRKLFDIHVRKKHPNLLHFICKICSKGFINRNLLQRHKERHQGKKPYSCSKCNMRFECLDALTAHVRRHLGKLPYVCKICKVGFDLHLDYKQHLRVHEMKPSEKGAYKVFPCSDCDKEFRKPCDLERHTRVHTGEKPYVCAVCGNKFQQAHNLTKHMIIHTQERRFHCEICLKQFGRSDVLTRHMLTHAVNKPFSCNVCDKTFGRALQLSQHTSKYHEVKFFKVKQ